MPPNPLWCRPIFVLLAAALIAFIAFGIRQSMGLYMRPISDGLGWGREILSFALATQNLLIGLAAPFSALFLINGVRQKHLRSAVLFSLAASSR